MWCYTDRTLSFAYVHLLQLWLVLLLCCMYTYILVRTLVAVTSWQVDKFVFIISKRSQTHEENTCRIILYTLWLKKILHTCIIPCNTTLVRHVDKISTKYTHTYHAYIYNITPLNRFKEFMKSIQFLSIWIIYTHICIALLSLLQ